MCTSALLDFLVEHVFIPLGSVLGLYVHFFLLSFPPFLVCLCCQIKAHLKEPGTISIEHTQNDYTLYESLYITFNPEEFAHVIEIYDFPAVFKTDDLLDAFAEHRWVNAASSQWISLHWRHEVIFNS